MARPSTNTGSKAWMPRRWRVGARLSMTGCSLITDSRASHTAGEPLSTSFLAALMLLMPLSTSFFMTKGRNSSIAISLGTPHW